MIPVPSGVQVWLATGYTDMRKGFDGLASLVQETLKRNPHNGHLFVFRGRRGLPDQGFVARWPRHVSVCKALGTRSIYLAIDGFQCPCGPDGDDQLGAAWLFAGRDWLAAAAAQLETCGRRLS